MVSVRQKAKAYDILRNYEGENGYIHTLKRKLLNNEELSDFQIEYTLDCHNFKKVDIGKIVRITKECGLRKKETWGTEFVPEKIKIISLLGETKTYYHCIVQYRQSVEPVPTFLPKKEVITDFKNSTFTEVDVDFDRFDNLSASNGSGRRLMKHQKEAVKFLLSRRKCILADDAGLGKTCSLSVAAIEGNFDSILIICPASLKTNWKRELMWYVPERDITIIEGISDKNKSELEKMLGYGIGKSGKKKEELLEEAKSNGKWTDNRFVIINYDILDEFYKIPKSWAKKSVDEAYSKSPMLQYIKGRKSLIIVDEAHNLSKSSSIRYKVIRDLFRRGEPHSIYLVTGTPLMNNPQNLYYILSLINAPVTSDYKFYTERFCGAKTMLAKGEYRRCAEEFLTDKGKKYISSLTDDEKKEFQEYLDDNAKHITTTSDATNLDELRERISPIYLRRVKEDLNDLPNKEIHEVLYDLFPEQKKKYDSLWEEYEAAQSEINPDKELNKDLLEGAVYRSFLSDAMVPYTIALANKIISGGEKVVIACCYDKELYTLQEYFGDKCVIFNGKMNAKQKDTSVERFTNDPNVMVFIGNIKSCGVGINLISSSHLIFNNMEFVYALNSQMQDRIHRIGQKKTAHIYYQIFRNTQYENMWNIVLRKQTIFNAVIKKEDEK